MAKKLTVTLVIIALLLGLAYFFKTNRLPLSTSPNDTQENEIICEVNEDCVMDLCRCKAINKKYFNASKGICERYCPGELACEEGGCVVLK